MPRHLTVFERVWKYTALGLSSIVFEEANPILGGIAARHGRAELLVVILSVALGTWVASLTLYYIGLLRIEWVRRKWPHKRAPLENALAMVTRHPWRSSLAVRFAYGLRLPLPIACGAARIPLRVFLTGSGVSCLAWAVAFAYFGLAAGGAAIVALHFTKRLEVRLWFLAIVLCVVLYALMRRRTSAARP